MRHLLEFASSSYLCLAKSSTPSLITERKTTKIKGATAENGFKGDTKGID